jgi:hypothetical protein
MSKLKVWQISSLILAVLCLAVLFLNNPFSKNIDLPTTVQAQKTEIPSITDATVPYRNVISFSIPNGSSNAMGAITYVPPNKKLYIKFASIRVTVPTTNPDKKVVAGITSNGNNSFVLSDQGVVGGFQNFVATHQMDIVYQTGLLNSGIYVNRNSTTGIANVSVYLVGELEQ